MIFTNLADKVYFAQNSNNVNVLMTLAGDGSGIREFVSKNPNSSNEVLEKIYLYDDTITTVENIAAHKNASKELLHRIAAELIDFYSIMRRVINNENVSIDTLIFLYSKYKKLVKEALKNKYSSLIEQDKANILLEMLNE